MIDPDNRQKINRLDDPTEGQEDDAGTIAIPAPPLTDKTLERFLDPDDSEYLSLEDLGLINFD